MSVGRRSLTDIREVPSRLVDFPSNHYQLRRDKPLQQLMEIVMQKVARYGLSGLLALVGATISLQALSFALQGLLGLVATSALTYYLWKYMNDTDNQPA